MHHSFEAINWENLKAGYRCKNCNLSVPTAHQAFDLTGENCYYAAEQLGWEKIL